MLSILIPIYNYNASPLVLELHKQCTEAEIDFEILCQDDCSSKYTQENLFAQTIGKVHYYLNNTNLGRGKNINILSQKAQFDYLLILDCDTYPKESSFIKKYIDSIALEKSKVVFGGIIYPDDKPNNEQLLRWIYGNKREAIPVEIRRKRGYKSALTSNFLIKKSVFNKYPFDETITKYGYEDLCFLTVLNSNKIAISHVANPTYHLNLETSKAYLSKTRLAIENLIFLIDSHKITEQDSRLFSTYNILRKLKLNALFGFAFKKTKNTLTHNLLSESPSLFLFDLYKLGYFSTLKKN